MFKSFRFALLMAGALFALGAVAQPAPERPDRDAGQRKARNVHHRFEPDLIVGDANVAFGRSPAARATATTAATAVAKTLPLVLPSSSSRCPSPRRRRYHRHRRAAARH